MSVSNLLDIQAFLGPAHAPLAAALRSQVPDLLAPFREPDDDADARSQARQVLSALGATGWFGLGIPTAFGGAADGPDVVACCLVREALAAISPLADSVFALQVLGTMPLTLAGSQELRQRWLPGVATGETMAAFAMTEEDAGSDVGAIATTAVRDGDGYRISGRKIFISNAGIADFYSVFARTGPGVGSKGLSVFVVPADAPGVRFDGPAVMSAPHPLGAMAFDDVRVPESWRVGKEGEGFALGMASLDRLRPTVAAAACGMARRALDEALAHVTERQQFGRPLARFQLVQAKLAQMAIDLDASRLLTYRAARSLSDGAEKPSLHVAMAKAHATEAAQRVVDGAIQLLGGRGLMRSHIVDLLYRSVRALRIYEGTTEIQHLIIARELLRGA